MTDYVIVLTTFPENGADTLAIALVEERLAACVNVLEPMRSIYRWKGRVEASVERQVIIKTAAAKVAALRGASQGAASVRLARVHRAGGRFRLPRLSGVVGRKQLTTYGAWGA